MASAHHAISGELSMRDERRPGLDGPGRMVKSRGFDGKISYLTKIWGFAKGLSWRWWSMERRSGGSVVSWILGRRRAPKKKVRESTQKVEIRSPCIEWVTMVVYMCSEVPGSWNKAKKRKRAHSICHFIIIMMKFSRFLRFSLCDSIIEFRSKSEIEIQILVTMNIFAEAVIPISFWLWSAPQGYAPSRWYLDAVSKALQGRPRLST